jgi:hypothetical protein
MAEHELSQLLYLLLNMQLIFQVEIEKLPMKVMEHQMTTSSHLGLLFPRHISKKLTMQAEQKKV